MQAYKGGPDLKKASKFIRDHFAKYLPAEQQESMQAHVTCALGAPLPLAVRATMTLLDTDQIRTVFLSIRSAITDRALANMGI